jgi:glycosyltransferase involved in cell wall biosynthesis
MLSWWIPDAILSCSEESVRVHTALGYDAKRMQVIPNGVDTLRFVPSPEARVSVRQEFGIPDEALLVGLIARLDSQKNHRGFFEAARVYFEGGGDAYFILAGRGVTPEGWQLSGWRDETGHPERIFLAGPREDISRVMAALDVATSSSLGEAFPMVLLEAMSCGVPCVATNVGDSGLIVSDTGVVVPPGDAEALADGWSQLLSMPSEDRRALGRQARARVEKRFRIEDMANRIWALYRATAHA